jgi:hypothetical protein
MVAAGATIPTIVTIGSRRGLGVWSGPARVCRFERTWTGPDHTPGVSRGTMVTMVTMVSLERTEPTVTILQESPGGLWSLWSVWSGGPEGQGDAPEAFELCLSKGQGLGSRCLLAGASPARTTSAASAEALGGERATAPFDARRSLLADSPPHTPSSREEGSDEERGEGRPRGGGSAAARAKRQRPCLGGWTSAACRGLRALGRRLRCASPSRSSARLRFSGCRELSGGTPSSRGLPTQPGRLRARWRAGRCSSRESLRGTLSPKGRVQLGLEGGGG